MLTDGLRAEREQGITIDVAYRYFATPARKFILADCPGHVQYTRNTVTGSSTADVIVLLVDARNGVVEQTRRHLAVASLLRVPHVILVVNKIDLGYSEDVFNRIATDFALLSRSLGVRDTHCIPVSATEGDNVVVRRGAHRGTTGRLCWDISSRSTTLPWRSARSCASPSSTLCARRTRNFRRGRHQHQLSTATTADTRARSNRDESASVRKWSSCLGSPTRGLKPSIP